MPDDFKTYANLLFENFYEGAVKQFNSDYGSIIAECARKGILNSSVTNSKIWGLAMSTASVLSEKRLELDLDTLSKFDLLVKESLDWLEANQNELLTNWEFFIVEKLQKPPINASFGENPQFRQELNKILLQTKRKIIAKSLEPEIVLPKQISQPQTIIHASGENQINIANNHGTVNATQVINQLAQIEEIAIKFLELLKKSDVTDNLKEETIDLLETNVCQLKNGTPKKTMLKYLGDKLESIITFVNNTASLAHSSNDLVNYANQLLAFIKT